MHANKAILLVVNQIDQLLGRIAPHDYRRPLAEFDGSTLGQHFRHILEFFQCLEKGVPQGMVDYASRERNLLFEDNPAIASAAFDQFVQMLGTVPETMVIDVKAEFGGAD